MSSEEESTKVNERIAEREILLTKFQGCLVGGAAGDALGYPVEFMTKVDIESSCGPRGIREYKLAAGSLAEISDDTQMTLFTANGLLIGDTRGHLRGIGGPSYGYCSNTYRDWLYTQDRSYDGLSDVSWLLTISELYSNRAPGNTCLSAIREDMGSIEEPINDSKGCGGVMRVAPIGLFWANYRREGDYDRRLLEHVVDEAAHCAALTHGHPLGYISAGAMAYIVCRCASEVPEGCEDPGAALFGIVEDCRRELSRWFPDQRDYAVFQADLLGRACNLAAAEKHGDDEIKELGEGWVGEEALAIGVYASLRYPTDFSAAIRLAVNHDGDSDSTGSICGQVVGALLGLDAIGHEWTDCLELRDVIMEVAKDLCDGCQMYEYGEYRDDRWMEKYVYACGGVKK